MTPICLSSDIKSGSALEPSLHSHPEDAAVLGRSRPCPLHPGHLGLGSSLTLPPVLLPESACCILQYYGQEFEQLHQPSQGQVDFDLGCSVPCVYSRINNVQCSGADGPSEFPQSRGVRKLHKNPDTPALGPEVLWRWCCDPAPGVLSDWSRESNGGPPAGP